MDQHTFQAALREPAFGMLPAHLQPAMRRAVLLNPGGFTSGDTMWAQHGVIRATAEDVARLEDEAWEEAFRDPYPNEDMGGDCYGLDSDESEDEGGTEDGDDPDEGGQDGVIVDEGSDVPPDVGEPTSRGPPDEHDETGDMTDIDFDKTDCKEADVFVRELLSVWDGGSQGDGEDGHDCQREIDSLVTDDGQIAKDQEIGLLQTIDDTQPATGQETDDAVHGQKRQKIDDVSVLTFLVVNGKQIPFSVAQIPPTPEAGAPSTPDKDEVKHEAKHAGTDEVKHEVKHGKVELDERGWPKDVDKETRGELGIQG